MSTKTNQTIADNQSTEKQKRKLSPLSKNNNKVISNKRSKQSNLTNREMDAIRELIESSMKVVSQQITTTQNALDNKISSLRTQISDDVKEKIDGLQQSLATFSNNVNTEIVNMKLELKHQSDRIQVNEDDISRVTLLNQLRITGILPSQNENLRSIFEKIAKEIDYNIDDSTKIPHLRRILSRKNGVISQTNTIILYFTASHIKDQFYSQYLHKVPFSKGFLNEMKCDKIIIGENLTKTNAMIFAKCLSYKKSGKIAQTFTNNGIVYIKFLRGKAELPHQIRTEHDLLNLIDKNNVVTTDEQPHGNNIGISPLATITSENQSTIKPNDQSNGIKLSSTNKSNITQSDGILRW